MHSYQNLTVFVCEQFEGNAECVPGSRSIEGRLTAEVLKSTTGVVGNLKSRSFTNYVSFFMITVTYRKSQCVSHQEVKRRNALFNTTSSTSILRIYDDSYVLITIKPSKTHLLTTLPSSTMKKEATSAKRTVSGQQRRLQQTRRNRKRVHPACRPVKRRMWQIQ